MYLTLPIPYPSSITGSSQPTNPRVFSEEANRSDYIKSIESKYIHESGETILTGKK
jgi:hypothetical protein